MISVLFSEPKIPQYYIWVLVIRFNFDFSALQRAENSSILHRLAARCSRRYFSALQRAENSSMLVYERNRHSLKDFSALQRAENSSMQKSPKSGVFAGTISVLFSEPKIPQLFAASDKPRKPSDFSALQRAENSSMRDRDRAKYAV